MAIAGAGGALALVVVVAIALASGNHPKRVGAESKATPAAPATTAAPAKPVSLSEGVVTQDDLGGAWTAKAPLAALPQATITQGPCGSALWGHDVAGYQSSYQLGRGAFGLPALVVSQVREAPSQQVADSQAAFVTSSSYAPCLQNLLELEAQLALKGAGLQVDGFAMDPLPLDVAVSNKQAYVVSVVVSDKSGESGVVTIDYVDVFTARYEATLEIFTIPGLGIDRDTLIQQQSERLAQRLAALPPNGTLASRSV
jgi:hypothetical protein